MGVSTDAILFYGFPLPDPADLDETPWYAEEDPSDRIDGLAERHGVRIDTHCSGSAPMYYVAIDKLTWVAPRGYPRAVDPSQMQTAECGCVLTNHAHWTDLAIRAFCADAGIEYRTPGWYLASWWDQ